MRVKRWLILSLMVLLTFCFNTSAFAWYGSGQYATVQDVHLTDTYWWARGLGFTDSEAKRIAKHDDGLDASLRFFDKTWHLDRSSFTGDTIDTRQKHADEEMAKAKYYISLVPGSGYYKAQYYRSQAQEHLGRGVHAVQDTYAHMDAGAGKTIPYNMPISHGMAGVMVDAAEVDGTISQLPVETLYDDVLWDYTPDEGWHKHTTKEESLRWTQTKAASEKYLYDFLLYGYGPGK